MLRLSVFFGGEKEKAHKLRDELTPRHIYMCQIYINILCELEKLF